MTMLSWDPDGTEVIRQFFVRLESFEIGRWLELWHHDGVQVMPFAPRGFPRRLEGRDAIFEQYKGLPERFRSMAFVDVHIEPLKRSGEHFVTYRGEIRLIEG